MRGRSRGVVRNAGQASTIILSAREAPPPGYSRPGPRAHCGALGASLRTRSRADGMGQLPHHRGEPGPGPRRPAGELQRGADGRALPGRALLSPGDESGLRAGPRRVGASTARLPPDQPGHPADGSGRRLRPGPPLARPRLGALRRCARLRPPSAAARDGPGCGAPGRHALHALRRLGAGRAATRGAQPPPLPRARRTLRAARGRLQGNGRHRAPGGGRCPVASSLTRWPRGTNASHPAPVRAPRKRLRVLPRSAHGRARRHGRAPGIIAALGRAAGAGHRPRLRAEPPDATALERAPRCGRLAAAGPGALPARSPRAGGALRTPRAPSGPTRTTPPSSASGCSACW